MRISILFAAMLLAGCATKNYGRQGELTDFERQTLTCREIGLEQAKVHGYLMHVEKESEFDARSVLSFLGDFGMGNVMEKNAALEAANKRSSQLQGLSASRGCMGTAAANGAAPAPAASTPSATQVQGSNPSPEPIRIGPPGPARDSTK